MFAAIAKGFLKFYVTQAAAGVVIGFTLPWLRLFGVL